MAAKVYCERCDSVFESREKFERHMESVHSGTACEVCVIDAAISRILGFFKK